MRGIQSRCSATAPTSQQQQRRRTSAGRFQRGFAAFRKRQIKMQLTIDNFDGAGARDYTAVLEAKQQAPSGAASEPQLRIERRLNRPSRATFALALTDAAVPVPVARARVVITTGAGATLFSGYINAAPAHEYLGWQTTGPVYRIACSAT